MYTYVLVYIYIYLYIYKFGPGVDSGSQPLSANNNKKPDTAHLLIAKPHAQSQIHELPYEKKKKTHTILFKRRNKNATLAPFNSTTPLPLYSL